MNNPFAFPFPDERAPDGSGLSEGSNGMLLRDWFAGMAVAGIAARGALPSRLQAKSAYDIADAMLAERNIKREAP